MPEESAALVARRSGSPGTFNPRAVLALLCAAQFMVVLDASIVNVALPSIGTALDFSQGNLSWVVNAYVLVFGCFLLLGGRLADLLGRRRVFVGGLALFSIASLAGGFATNEVQLIAARALQGLGGALFSPAALSIITATFREEAARNKALGAWGAVAGSAGAAGVLLGGLLTDWAGWQWIFWVNVPIGLAVALVALRLVPDSRNSNQRRTFDLPGAMSVTAGLLVLVYALVNAHRVGWDSPQTLVLLVLAAALLLTFGWIERRSPGPLVPGRLVQVAAVRGANAVGLLVGAALFSMFYFISLYMQQVLEFTPLQTGLGYLPLSLTIIVSATVASRLSTRFGVRPTLMVGLAFMAAGLLWFSQISTEGSFASDVLGPSLLAAVGLGLSFVPTTIGAVSGVAPDDSGVASGFINASQQVGGALGVAVLATVANSHTANALLAGSGDPAELPAALTEGFQLAFAGGAGFALVGLALTAVLIPGRRDRPPTGDAEEGIEPAAAAV